MMDYDMESRNRRTCASLRDTLQSLPLLRPSPLRPSRQRSPRFTRWDSIRNRIRVLVRERLQSNLRTLLTGNAGPPGMYHAKLKAHALGGLIDETIQIRYDILDRPKDVVSTRALSVGHIIAVDKSLCTVLDAQAIWRRCGACFNEARLAVQPCAGCRTTMYCDARCERMSEETTRIHHYECRMAEYLNEFPDMRLVVRLVLITFQSTADVEDMIQHCRYHPKYRGTRRCVYRQCDFFSLLSGEHGTMPRSYIAKLVWDLRNHPQHRKLDKWELTALCRQATYLYLTLLKTANCIYPVCVCRPHRNFMRLFIFELVQVTSTIAPKSQRLWSSVLFPGEKPRPRSATVGLFPLWCTLNHSCEPNVAAIPIGPDRLLLCALRPIRRGEPLSVDRTYDDFDVEALGEDVSPKECLQFHQDLLWKKCRLSCNCDNYMKAFDWFPFPNAIMPYKRYVIPPFSTNTLQRVPTIEQFLERIYTLNDGTVSAFFAEICKYMQSIDRRYPSKELYEARNLFDICLQRMYGPILEENLADNDEDIIVWEPHEWDAIVTDRNERAIIEQRIHAWLKKPAPNERYC